MVSKTEINIDTSNLTEEDLQELFRILEEVYHEKSERKQQLRSSKALMTHCEVFSPTKPFNKIVSDSPFPVFDTEMMFANAQQQVSNLTKTLSSPLESPGVARNCIVTDTENEFRRLSVKDKALWYERNTSQQSQSSFHLADRSLMEETRTEANYVKRLCSLWEERLNISKCSDSSSVSLEPKKKEIKSLNCSLERSTKEEVQLKTPEEKVKLRKVSNHGNNSMLQNEEIRKNLNRLQFQNHLKFDCSTEIDGHHLELSQKRRHQSMTSKVLKSEFLAPPKKIRRLNPRCPMLRCLLGKDAWTKRGMSLSQGVTTAVVDELYSNRTFYSPHNLLNTTITFNSEMHDSKAKMLNDDHCSGTIDINSNSSEGYPESHNSDDVSSVYSENFFVPARKQLYCSFNGGEKIKLNSSSDPDEKINCVPKSAKLSQDFNKLDKPFKPDLYSPRKVTSVYTVTSMYTPSFTQVYRQKAAEGWSITPVKQKGSHCNKDRDTFIDQGFETGSNETQSPIRYKGAQSPLEGNWKNFMRSSTPNGNNGTYLLQNLPNNVSPIKFTNKGAESGLLSDNNASEFWISFGNYTISLKIDHSPWERLLILRKAFVQEHTEENLDVNFGIDKQIFPLHSKSILFMKGLVQRLTTRKTEEQHDDCSQYWFSKGNVWLPFRGPLICMTRIQKVFKCLQEFREQSYGGYCLSFGIDKYVFFTSYKSESGVYLS